MDTVKQINVSIIEAARCGDDCQVLDRVLRACKNVEAIKTVDPNNIDHVLAEHWDYRKICPIGNCRWREISMITVGRKKEVDLHGHLYHGVPMDIDREDDDEKEDGDQWIEYKSISADLGLCTMQFGDRSTVNNLQNAKFRDLKAEMMRNEYYPLNEHEWSQLLTVCRVLATSTRAQIMGMAMMEIVALKIYADFPILRKYIRRCFHEKDQSKRVDFQRTFYNLNSMMGSAVNKSPDEIGGRLYIPIFNDDDVMNQSAISRFTCFGPTIFYTDYDTANALGAGNVTVLELYPPFDRRGMDLSWISSYSNGPRILFIGGTLQIVDVHSRSKDLPAFNRNPEDIDLSIAELIKMQNEILIAVQNVSVNEGEDTLSLNKENRRGLFAKLSDEQMISILTLLALQYRSEICEQIMLILRENSESHRLQGRLRAVLYLRDYLIDSLSNVRNVAMDDMSASLRRFFTQNAFHSECADFQQPNYNNSRERPPIADSLRYDAPTLSMMKILKLFPMAHRMTISGDDFDWTLQQFVDFAKAHDFESEHVALRHIHLAVAEDEALRLLDKHKPRSSVKSLRKRGWKMLTPIDLCYFGSMPEPEPPFLPMFINALNFHLKRCQNIQIRGRTVSGYSYLMRMEQSDEAPRYADDDSVETEDEMFDIEYNAFWCTLSCDVFYALDYQQALVASLTHRKDGRGRRPLIDGDGKEFGERCSLVESLVLDPLPMKLQPIFCEEDIFSFELTLNLFPNITDLYLRTTRFDSAICRRFVEFIEKQSDSMNLERIYFSISDRMKLKELPNVQWRLKEVGWRFLNSQQVLMKCALPKWQCKKCGHWNRSMMIGGVYHHPRAVGTECALCYFGDDDGIKRGDADRGDEIHIDSVLEDIPDEILSEFTAIGNSKCRKSKYFDRGQFIYVLDHHIFSTMDPKRHQKLAEHKKVILEYFGTLPIYELLNEENWMRIAKELSVRCCGTVKLALTIKTALLKRMDSIDTENGDKTQISGIWNVPHCAALERIQFILKHFGRWTVDAVNNDNEYMVRISDFLAAMEGHDECPYSLQNLQRDLDHIFEHRNFMQMAIDEPCGDGEQCIHCQRNKKFGDGAGSVLESTK